MTSMLEIVDISLSSIVVLYSERANFFVVPLLHSVSDMTKSYSVHHLLSEGVKIMFEEFLM